MIFHKHKWRFHSMHFTPPGFLGSGRAEGYEIVRRNIEGITNVCQAVREETVYGKFVFTDKVTA